MPRARALGMQAKQSGMTATAVVMLTRGDTARARGPRERAGRDAEAGARRARRVRTQRQQAGEHAAWQRPGRRAARGCAAGSACTADREQGRATAARGHVPHDAMRRRAVEQPRGAARWRQRLADTAVVDNRCGQRGRHGAGESRDDRHGPFAARRARRCARARQVGSRRQRPGAQGPGRATRQRARVAPAQQQRRKPQPGGRAGRQARDVAACAARQRRIAWRQRTREREQPHLVDAERTRPAVLHRSSPCPRQDRRRGRTGFKRSRRSTHRFAAPFPASGAADAGLSRRFPASYQLHIAVPMCTASRSRCRDGACPIRSKGRAIARCAPSGKMRTRVRGAA